MKKFRWRLSLYHRDQRHQRAEMQDGWDVVGTEDDAKETALNLIRRSYPQIFSMKQVEWKRMRDRVCLGCMIGKYLASLDQQEEIIELDLMTQEEFDRELSRLKRK